MRRRLLREMRPRPATLADRLYAAFALLALPAPHLVRAIVSVALVVAVVGTATVASADALPDEPLYGMKVAGEQFRLAIARTPEDRAAVELSMAEHRLAEAERLALAAREPDALIATSAYGTHLANAAAELATVERLETAARPVVDQLKRRLAEQQQRAADVAAHLVNDPLTAAGASLFRTVASFAPAQPSGASIAEGIAEHAASVAGRLAAVAERLAVEAEQAEAPDEDDTEADEDGMTEPDAAPARLEPARPAVAAPAAPSAARATPARPAQTPGPTATARRTDPPRTAKTARPTARPDPKKVAEAQAARAVAEKAKAEAAKARIAAEKAKEAAKKTASPQPTATPRR